MEYNDLLNELLDLLDENIDIKNIKSLKKKLMKDKSFQENLALYHEQKSVDDKKKLYENKDYLKLETEINLLIQNIKKEFKVFNSRGGICEGH